MSELSEAIELTSDDDTPEEDRKMLKGIVKFGDMFVKEIMKARMDVTSVELSTSYSDLLTLILSAGYSRIPAYKESFDKISGILYVKDLLPHLDKPADFAWEELLRPAFFVPENKRISDLLQEFQEKKIHLAIVVDEYGGTSGIVTLEDIIEEIVGEISDEFDTEEDEISFTKIDDKNYIFEGKTLLNDFCKILDINDRVFEDVKGDSETLAGLILEIEGRIPALNASTKFNNFEFHIRKVSNRRIEEILVKILK
jgi:gliding motility-associated protein GldE